jgi:hypothetical protein
MSDTGLLCWFYVYKDDKICGIFIIKKVEETPMFFYSKTSLDAKDNNEIYENDDLIKQIIATTFKTTNSPSEENNIFTFNQENPSMVCGDYRYLEWYLKDYFNMNTL